MKVLDVSTRIPVYSWCDPIDQGALQQIENLAALPVCFHHVALMPDAHSGFGMPIGGVCACRGVVIPNAVGVDIGCGVRACRLSLSTETLTPAELAGIIRVIQSRVPLGFRHHTTPQEWEGFSRAPDIAVVTQELGAARFQLGTLGGGNHFIEFQKDEDNGVWIMVHSGSRNFGYTIARWFHEQALQSCARKKKKLPDPQLAWLDCDHSLGRHYLQAMAFTLDFARENRARLLAATLAAVQQVLPECRAKEVYEIHHNYAAQETHFGHQVVVHRKGATSARQNEYGLVPGSMGTASYIVQGLGNQDSFCSCSHGAGRRMGRNQANRILSEEMVKQQMRGIVYEMGRLGGKKRGKTDLSESPFAYKEIECVMQAQHDLVRPVRRLFPLGVLKG